MWCRDVVWNGTPDASAARARSALGDGRESTLVVSLLLWSSLLLSSLYTSLPDVRVLTGEPEGLTAHRDASQRSGGMFIEALLRIGMQSVPLGRR